MTDVTEDGVSRGACAKAAPPDREGRPRPLRGVASAASQAFLEQLQLSNWRVHPASAQRKTADWEYARGEVVTLPAGAPCELEFLVPAHLVAMLPEGNPRGFEISDGNGPGKVESVGAGALLFNAANNYLRVRKTCKNRCGLLLVAIDPAAVNRLTSVSKNTTDLDDRSQINFYDEEVRSTLLKLRSVIEDGRSRSQLYCHSLILMLLAQLMECASSVGTSRRPAYVKGGLSNWRLRRALELLDAGLDDAPSISTLARAVELHPTSFCRAFRQSMGISPHRYLLEKRIALAKKLMADRRLTLTQIGLDCGFSSSSQFSVIFRRLVGTSPRTYRKCIGVGEPM